MPGKTLSDTSVVPFPGQPETESLLAFQFDDDGKPRIIAEFNSEQERFALLCLAQSVVSEFIRETGYSAASAYRSDETRQGNRMMA